MKNTLTIKKRAIKRSSLERSAGYSTVEYLIVLDGKQVGTCDEENFAIRLMVNKEDINSDGNPNCKWRWAEFKFKPTDLENAKQWLYRNSEVLINAYTLHTTDL